jgi:predicted PurR-regulated permease PerM
VGLNVTLLGLLLVLLYEVRGILAITLVAVFLTMAVNPIVLWLQKRRFPRGWAIFTVVVVFVVVFGLLILSFVPMLMEQGKSLVDAFPGMMDKLQQSGPFKWAQDRLNLIERAQATLEKHGGEMATSVLGVLGSVVVGLVGFGTALVLSVFMLIFGKELVEQGLELLGARRKRIYAPILEHVRVTVGRYVLGTIVVALIGGAIITLALVILGVPYFVPLGFTMVFAGLVPYLGPTIGAVLIVGVTLAQAGWAKALVMAAVFLGYQFVEGNLLQPIIQRRAIQLNPLVVVLAMLAGATVGGIVGAVVALPIVGTIKAVLLDVRKHRSDEATDASEFTNDPH